MPPSNPLSGGAPTSGKKTIELKDDGPRGEGRLALIIRFAGSRITSEWYAVWWADGKRGTAKMGAYPAMSLAEARKSFAADYASSIARGERPEGFHARKSRLGVTVHDLFQTYVDHLRKANKASANRVERILLTGGKKGGKPAAKALGPAKRAADVTSPSQGPTSARPSPTPWLRRIASPYRPNRGSDESPCVKF
jgi:hypothetical protein